MDASTAPIRTPDHRLRVFVSSTLRELEPERRAAREAIESLRLAPVMFELGARPHPPRALYRSYLAQSDVFVGIYGASYGWVAPDEEVSGLEDEYRLSSGKPRLIYLRTGLAEREPRLKELVDRIRSDDSASYRSFATPEELRELLVGDLAVLLAERFDASTRRVPLAVEVSSAIPAAFGALIGRERDLAAILDLLATPGTRMVTVVGSGGIGKSRLAIAVAEASAASGREVGFTALESLRSAEEVIPEIARSLRVRDGDGERPEDTLFAALAGRDTLLVVDNMEHLLEASDALVRLLNAAPRVQLLVTSRSPLHVRAENVIELSPLDVPAPGAGAAETATASGVAFFVARARAVDAGFVLDERNAADVAGIVRAVDGVPLAIELAAARVRLLTPGEILARLDRRLTQLGGGARDLPPRQRALRSTIEWSLRLLDPAVEAAFDAIAVFPGPFSARAAEAVLAGELDIEVAEALEALLDASLLHRYERRGELVFNPLAIVHAFARERSTPGPALVDRWLAYYVELAAGIDAHLHGADQVPSLLRLDAEVENLSAVERHLLDERMLARAAEFAWSLYFPLWIGGRLGLVRAWMAELLATAADEGIPLAPRTEAIALYYTGAVSFWQDAETDVVPWLARSMELFAAEGDRRGAGLAGLSLALAHLAQGPPDVGSARAELHGSLDSFRAAGDVWGEAMAQVTLGRVDMALGDMVGAAARFDESVREAASQDELLGMAIALHHRGWPRFLAGDLDGALADFADALHISLQLRHDEGIVYGLQGLVGVAAARGRAEETGLLLGAAARMRRRTGLVNAAAFTPEAGAVQALRDSGAGPDIDAAAERGQELALEEVLRRVGE
jgi:predicted ATPase